MLFRKKTLTADDRYVFIHIGKSAGTTIRKGLARQFKRGERCPYFFHGAVAGMTEVELNRYRFISAHIGYDLASSLSTNLFTVLREPYDRVISLYYYWRQLEGEQGGAGIAKRLSFEEFVESDATPVIVDLRNTQTWQLAHGHDAPARIKYGKQLSPEELLATAKENLERLKVVGFQENLPRFLDKVNACFDWKVGSVKRLNGTSKRPAVEDLPVLTKQKIQKFVELDVELYAYAFERFGGT